MAIEPLNGRWTGEAVFVHAIDTIRERRAQGQGSPRGAIAIWINEDGSLSHAITETTYEMTAVFAALCNHLAIEAMEP